MTMSLPVGLFVAGRSDDVGLVADDRTGLVDVEGLALRDAVDDVDEDYVGVVALSQTLRSRSRLRCRRLRP